MEAKNVSSTRCVPTLPTALLLEPKALRVAVVGTGLAGAACAHGLRQANIDVTCFERASQVGGRMASRRVHGSSEAGSPSSVAVDHGAQYFTAVRPRFRGVMARAVAAGRAARWQPIVHSGRSARSESCFVPTPGATALCEHLLGSTPLQLGRSVQRLQKAADGAWFVASEGAPLSGPFQHVVLAVPPAQAALLLAGHHDAWAASFMARHMEPCWTLMAVTDDVDWPWDAAKPERGALAWVLRNDRLPGRSAPAGLAVWTAHATAAWSAERVDADPKVVCAELQAALRAQLPTVASEGRQVRWHYADVHRWRHAGPTFDCDDAFDGGEAWWDETLCVGVCGDWLGGGGVESAWHSGDELADVMAASFEKNSDVSYGAPRSIFSADGNLVTG